MFKLLYKALLISLISGSLTTMNMTAFAQTATSGMSRTGYIRGADGVLSKTEIIHYEGTGKDDDNAIQVITMLAIGVIGTKLLMYKKWTTDMTTAAIGSAVYIAAEIKNITNLKSQLKDVDAALTRRTDGEVDQSQIDTLEKLKESYQEVKKSAESKKSFQKMAATAYMAATGIAIWQRFTEDGQLASCQAGIAEAQAELTACTTKQTALAAEACAATVGVGCSASIVFTDEATACTLCGAALVELSAGLTTTKAKDQIPAPSLTKALESAPADLFNKAKATLPCPGVIAEGIKAKVVTPSCTTYIVNKELQKGFGASFVEASNQLNISGFNKMLFSNSSINQLPKNMSIDPTSGPRSMLQKMVDLFLPKAEAGWVSMLGLGAGAAAAFFTAQTAIGRTIDTYLFTPGGRIIAWGVMWTAANMGAKATQKEIDKIETHIAKIDQVLKDIRTLQKGVTAANVKTQQLNLASFNVGQEQSLQINSDTAVRTDCLTGAGNSNCAPISSQLMAMPGFGSLPSSFQTIASQTAGIGDGLSGTNAISGSTLAAINQYGNNQGAIKKLTDSLKKKLNDSLAKNKQPQIDFDKKEKALLAKLNTDTSNALKRGNMSAGSFLSSIGLSPISSAKAAIAAVPAPKKASSSASGSISTPSKEKGLELDFNEVPSGETGNFAAAGGTQGDEKFDIGSNDINTNSGESIFQVISNRYIKSGYPRLLEEIAAKE